MSLELIVTFKFIKINAKDDSFLLFLYKKNEKVFTGPKTKQEYG